MSESTKKLVLAIPQVVRASLHELRKRRIHPHFAGYLCVLRAAAATKSTQGLKVDFKRFFNEFLAYGKPTVDRPYIVPFSESEGLGRIFFNKNVSGSYSPSSLRPGYAFRQVVDVNGTKTNARYTLPEDHAALALNYFLYGQRLSMISLAIFLFRDYAFKIENTDDYLEILISEFALEFNINKFDGSGLFDMAFEDSGLGSAYQQIAQPFAAREEH